MNQHQFSPGQTCVVTHDVPVGTEGIAFQAGERVVIEQVQPNPQKPEYKYVVMSQALNKRFQLRDTDLELEAPATTQAYAAIQTPIDRQKKYPAPEGKQRSARGRKANRKQKPSLSVKTWIIIGVCAVIVVAAVVVGVVFGLGNGDNKGSVTTESTSPRKTDSGKTFTNENWALACSSPSRYEGSKVEGLVGKIFVEPERSEGGVAIQMFADPQASSENTIVYYYGSDSTQFSNGDLIKVNGKVGGEFEGTNAMGATLNLPTIIADSVVKTDAAAMITGGKEVPVYQQQNQHGVLVAVDKVVLQDSETDVFVKVNNQSGDNARFSAYSAKLQIGNKQLDPDSSKQYQYGDIPSEILPGVEASGIIVFPAIGSPIPESGTMALHLQASSDNYRLDFDPYIFTISW